MARSRIIKPEFFQNEELVALPPIARLLFIGLWQLADRDGRQEDRPGKIKLAVLPADDCDVDDLLRQLAEKELIVRYEVAGARYLAIPKFHLHQCPHISEKSKGIPPPNPPSAVQAPDKHSASTVLAPDQHRTSLAHSDSDCGSDSGSKNTSPKLRFTDDDLGLAQEMFQLIRELNPNAKEPNLNTWANEFRLMRERDGADRTLEGIRDLMRWALGHSFWKSNVLCPAKLREQWDRLTIQWNEQQAGRQDTSGKSRVPTAEDLANWSPYGQGGE